MDSQITHGDGPGQISKASGAPYSSVDEVASVLARIRAERRPGPENRSGRWQVRIGWAGSAESPPFSFDTRDSREDAEYCARHAMTWKRADDGLYVTGAWVRKPGASEWEPVTLPQAVTP